MLSTVIIAGCLYFSSTLVLLMNSGLPGFVMQLPGATWCEWGTILNLRWTTHFDMIFFILCLVIYRLFLTFSWRSELSTKWQISVEMRTITPASLVDRCSFTWNNFPVLNIGLILQGMKFMHASTNFVETRDYSSSLPPLVRVCTLSFVALYFFLSPGLTHNQEDVSIPELGWERCVWCRRRGLRIWTLLEVLWLNRNK